MVRSLWIIPFMMLWRQGLIKLYLSFVRSGRGVPPCNRGEDRKDHGGRICISGVGRSSAGFEKPADRTKPWGTGQAVLAAKAVLNEPFMVINADDYYGKEAYVKVHDYLIQEQPDDGILHICMAGFRLGNTLSDNGSVTRGVCHIEEGALTGVTETHNIFKTADGAEARNDDKSRNWM